MIKTQIINCKFDKQIDNLLFFSKNLYNYANYFIRQQFINKKLYISYRQIYELVKQNQNYKLLPAQGAQQVLRLLDKNWKSFFRAIKSWSRDKSKFNGIPKMPRYKNKDGRNILIIPFNNLTIDDSDLTIKIPKTKFKIKISKRMMNFKLKQIRIIPTSIGFKCQIVYDDNKIFIKKNDNNKYCSVDLGINNFSTLVNNFDSVPPIIINGKIIKSNNQYYNKKLAELTSKLSKNTYSSKRIRRLTVKRNNKIKDSLHKISKYLQEYCIDLDMSRFIIGYNKQ